MGIKKMLSSRFGDGTMGQSMGQRHSEQGPKDIAKVQYSFISSISGHILIIVVI